MDATSQPKNPYGGPRARRTIHDKSDRNRPSPTKGLRRSPRYNQVETSDSDNEEPIVGSDNEESTRSRSNSLTYTTEKKITYDRADITEGTSWANISNTSNRSSATEKKLKFTLECADITGGTSWEDIINASKKEPEKSPVNNSILIIIALIVVGVVLGLTFRTTKPTVPIPTKVLCPQFKELVDQFSQDLILWQSLKIGIEGVLNNKPTTPSVFLLAYNDIHTAERVMKKVVAATASCMNSTNPIQLDGRTFVTQTMLEDYGEIIAEYRERLEHDGIMYVSDLSKMPAEAAEVFHTICDTITPLVNRAVIFFTVYVDQYDDNLSSKKVSELVESELETNWFRNRKVSDDTLKALIARVTDQVFLLKSEH